MRPTKIKAPPLATPDSDPTPPLTESAKPDAMTDEQIAEAFRAAGGTPKTTPKDWSETLRQPAKYKAHYPTLLIDFFNRPHFHETPETWYNPDGSVKREGVKLVPNPPPHFSEFARSLGVHESTLTKWAKLHPQFNQALLHAEAMRKEYVVNNALLGLYNPIFAKLVAANWFGWFDKQEIDIQHTNTMIKYHKPDRLKLPLPKKQLPPP